VTAPLWSSIDNREAAFWRTDQWESLSRQIAAATPTDGFFLDKTWRTSPVPFFLSPAFVEELEWLGRRLLAFYQAANLLYKWSINGRAPGWIADYLDRGKPPWLVEAARSPALQEALPAVIRPDLILTDTGYAIAELDSVPGGIGLTAWLNQTYANLGFEMVGGTHGMLDGFRSILPAPDTLIAISEESATYRPEMAWLARTLAETGRAHPTLVDAEKPLPPDRPVYRFFELFDLPNLPGATNAIREAADGRRMMTPPPRPLHEEKLWLPLLWSAPLAPFWKEHLGSRFFRDLRNVVPQGWILDPSPLPHFAVIPGLDIPDWEALKHFTQRQRQLVLKISGFSPNAWGSRGVTIGHDVSQTEWSHAVTQALAQFPTHPHLLQRFAHSRIFHHPIVDDHTIPWQAGRVRLCPYYFVHQQRTTLGGVLVTFCPPDKKILHGMRDAAILPAAIA